MIKTNRPLEKCAPVPSTSSFVAITARIDSINTPKCLFLAMIALSGIMPKIMITDAIRIAATIGDAHPEIGSFLGACERDTGFGPASFGIGQQDFGIAFELEPQLLLIEDSRWRGSQSNRICERYISGNLRLRSLALGFDSGNRVFNSE